MNYKFSKPTFNVDKTLKELVLQSKHTKIVLTTKKGHIHFKASGKHRKSALTHVMGDLTAFEAKIVAIYLFKELTVPYLTSSLDPNYASIFGSCHD